jgi:hypothetical protein
MVSWLNLHRFPQITDRCDRQDSTTANEVNFAGLPLASLPGGQSQQFMDPLLAIEPVDPDHLPQFLKISLTPLRITIKPTE